MGFILPRDRGFSIVELLISVAIGLLALGFATRLVTSSESAKSSAIGTSDSMQSGMLAMFSINGDAQQAGFGLNDPLLIGCDTSFTDKHGYKMIEVPGFDAEGNAVTVTPLSPVIIESFENDSDRITLYAGTSNAGTNAVRVVSDAASETNQLSLDRRPHGFASGDVVVLAPEDRKGKCVLSQVSQAPGTESTLSVSAGGAEFRFNTGSFGQEINGGRTRLFNLGRPNTLAFHTWSVEDGFLRLRATDMTGAGETPVTVADDIVAIKAQYGFDTRIEKEFDDRLDLKVGEWSATMIDADKDGRFGNAGDYQHLAAVRIAVIARSKKRERRSVGGECVATKEAPIVFGSEAPAGVTAVPVTVNLAVKGDSVDWRCYRYRVFETVVPLRNMQWSPGHAIPTT